MRRVVACVSVLVLAAVLVASTGIVFAQEASFSDGNGWALNRDLQHALPVCCPAASGLEAESNEHLFGESLTIVGENNVQMAYYLEVAAVLISTRVLPTTSTTRTCA